MLILLARPNQSSPPWRSGGKDQRADEQKQQQRLRHGIIARQSREKCLHDLSDAGVSARQYAGPIVRSAKNRRIWQKRQGGNYTSRKNDTRGAPRFSQSQDRQAAGANGEDEKCVDEERLHTKNCGNYRQNDRFRTTGAKRELPD